MIITQQSSFRAQRSAVEESLYFARSAPAESVVQAITPSPPRTPSPQCPQRAASPPGAISPCHPSPHPAPAPPAAIRCAPQPPASPHHQHQTLSDPEAPAIAAFRPHGSPHEYPPPPLKISRD